LLQARLLFFNSLWSPVKKTGWFLAKVRLSGICNATLNIVEFVIRQKTPSFFSSAPAYSHQFCLLKINPVNLNVKTFKEKPKFDTVRAIANCLMLRAALQMPLSSGQIITTI